VAEEMPARHLQAVLVKRVDPFDVHCFVMTSSRFKIKLAITAYAASSSAFSFVSLG